MKNYSSIIGKEVKTGEAAKCAGLSQNHLNQWVQRGLVRPSTPAHAKGPGAKWDLLSIVLVRLMKVLVDMGWSRTNAGWVTSRSKMQNLIGKLIKDNSGKRQGTAITQPWSLNDPLWLMFARDGGDLEVDYYLGDFRRIEVITKFERYPEYTGVNLATVLNAVCESLE